MHSAPGSTLDAEYLVGLLMNRRHADEPEAAYWAGRIDGHCLQNAIGLDELKEIARDAGYEIDWECRANG